MHIQTLGRRRLRVLSRLTLLARGLLLALLLMPLACDEDDESDWPQRQANDLARQLETERRAHRQDMDRAATEMEQVRQDAGAVSSALLSCAIAIVVLVILLARERRCRRILERLLRMLLDRIHGPRMPP